MKSEHGCFKESGREFHYACFSDRGCVRSVNEDDFLVAPRHNVVAVADGVGGLEGGEVASNISLMAVKDSFDKMTKRIFTRIFSGHGKRIEDELTWVIESANTRVYKAGIAQGKRFATTLVLLSMNNGHCCIAHVGDSRAYLFRKNNLSLLTTDHTVAQELAEKNVVGFDSPANSQYHNVITRAIGAENTVEPDFRELALQEDDSLLLCSDGLTSMVSEILIQEILQQKKSIYSLGMELVDAAKESGGRDNITVALIQCKNMIA